MAQGSYTREPSEELREFRDLLLDRIGRQFLVRNRFAILAETIQVDADRVRCHGPSFFQRVALGDQAGQGGTSYYVAAFVGGLEQHCKPDLLSDRNFPPV